MREYIANETILGWSINDRDKPVEISRSGQSVEVLKSPLTISGENVLVVFVLTFESIW